MVGRPYPKYSPYTGTSKPDEEEEKKKKVDEEDLDKEIARLEKLKERALKKTQIRSIKQEIFKEEHPKVIGATKRGRKALGRIASFTGLVTREGVVRPLRGTARRRRRGRRGRGVSPTPISVRASQDISLTKAIAQNDWSGSGLMDRDFFGSPERELLPTSVDLNLVSSGAKEIDLLGQDKKSKPIRYI